MAWLLLKIIIKYILVSFSYFFCLFHLFFIFIQLLFFKIPYLKKITNKKTSIKLLSTIIFNGVLFVIKRLKRNVGK
ncbi:MAG: hypothetical protein EAX96_06455 [Candidatus Lokiarchaeota archaeon]|nr:hypothetical protein [Candidatus Lokiarchaeota archaeon]